MSFYYTGEHTITIGDKNTWTDWHLIPSSRPFVVPAQPKYTFTDIPGMNGSLDTTESLLNYVTYKNREGSWEFFVENDKEETWAELLSIISMDTAGQRLKVVLNDDPNWYYIGRVFVNNWASEQITSKITLNYNLEPFKYSNYSTLGDWLWDPFNFNKDYCYDWADISVTGKRVLEFNWPGAAVTPTITVGGTANGMDFTFNSGKKVHLGNGTFTSPFLSIVHGKNTLVVEAWTGNFTISTRDSRL